MNFDAVWQEVAAFGARRTARMVDVADGTAMQLCVAETLEFKQETSR